MFSDVRCPVGQDGPPCPLKGGEMPPLATPVGNVSLRAGECGTCTATIAATLAGQIVSAELPPPTDVDTEQAAVDAGGTPSADGVEGPNSL